MPRIHKLSERPTVDLHADWWSSAQRDGRFVERCVIYAEYLQADDSYLSGKLLASVSLDRATLEKAAASKDGNKVEIDMTGAAHQTRWLFQRMVVELTDETGALCNVRDDATYEGLAKRDAEYIMAEIEKLREVPAVLPTALDSAFADATGKSAEAVAQDSFRSGGEAPLLGE